MNWNSKHKEVHWPQAGSHVIARKGISRRLIEQEGETEGYHSRKVAGWRVWVQNDWVIHTERCGNNVEIIGYRTSHPQGSRWNLGWWWDHLDRLEMSLSRQLSYSLDFQSLCLRGRIASEWLPWVGSGLWWQRWWRAVLAWWYDCKMNPQMLMCLWEI